MELDVGLLKMQIALEMVIISEILKGTAAFQSNPTVLKRKRGRDLIWLFIYWIPLGSVCVIRNN